jgi:ubiquinone/menaquinone biosynthesis C-methylase UbiE
MKTHQEQNAAIRDQFGKQAPGYARLLQQQQTGKPDPLIALLGLSRSDTVLDVGCGTGRFSLALARLAGRVTGLDLTPEMLDQARAAQTESEIANITWQLGDMLPLPFTDGAFSVVVTQATFHHLADPGAVFAEMVRVCAPEGRIAVRDLTPDAAKREAFDAIEKLRDPSHVRALLCEELQALGAAASLEEVALERHAATLPMEAVLATSFPAPGDLERVRALYREDAVAGKDRLGLSLREADGEILGAYPATMLLWRRRG